MVINPAPERVNSANQYQLPGALDVLKRPLGTGKAVGLGAKTWQS